MISDIFYSKERFFSHLTPQGDLPFFKRQVLRFLKGGDFIFFPKYFFCLHKNSLKRQIEKDWEFKKYFIKKIPIGKHINFEVSWFKNFLRPSLFIKFPAVAIPRRCR